jgi:hypothetical protein
MINHPESNESSCAVMNDNILDRIPPWIDVISVYATNGFTETPENTAVMHIKGGDVEKRAPAMAMRGQRHSPTK